MASKYEVLKRSRRKTIKVTMKFQLRPRTISDIPKEIRIEFVNRGKRRGIRSIDTINGLKRGLKLLRRIEIPIDTMYSLIENAIIECIEDGKLNIQCFDMVFLKNIRKNIFS